MMTSAGFLRVSRGFSILAALILGSPIACSVAALTMYLLRHPGGRDGFESMMLGLFFYGPFVILQAICLYAAFRGRDGWIERTHFPAGILMLGGMRALDSVSLLPAGYKYMAASIPPFWYLCGALLIIAGLSGLASSRLKAAR